MAGLSLNHPFAFAFGLLGNIISFMVYLAPAPTFYRVYKKKSTEGFQSVPYVVALFSAMLWIYYALVKGNSDLLITINTVGCVIETIYISIFLKYAPRKAKVSTAKLLLALNVGLFGLILLLTLVLTKGSGRVLALGWICVAFSVSVYVAPLSIIRLVIRTRSVEFMPFSLSFFLTLSAIVWFGYGYLNHDKYVAIPNILGFAFGALQMILYLVYKNAKPTPVIPVTTKNIGDHESCNKQDNTINSEHIVTIVNLTTTTTAITTGTPPVAAVDINQVYPIDAATLTAAADDQNKTEEDGAIAAATVAATTDNNNGDVKETAAAASEVGDQMTAKNNLNDNNIDQE